MCNNSSNNKLNKTKLLLIEKNFNTINLLLSEETYNELINKTFEQNIKIYKKNDNRYYINYEGQEFLFTWKNIVNKKNIELLEFTNKLRKKYVDKLQKLIVKYFESSCTNTSSVSYNKFCKIDAMGSTALTSNYDINVSSFLVSTNIVSKFNKYFYMFWNDTSGEIFDTNLYGNSFFITIDKKLIYNENLLNFYNVLISGNNNIFYLPPPDRLFHPDIKNIIFKQQISWLVIKIYLYLDEFKDYINIQNNNRNNRNNSINKKLGLILKNIKQIILKNISSKNIDEQLLSKYNTLTDEKIKIHVTNMSDNLYRKKLDELYVSKLCVIDKYQKQYINQKNNKNNLLIDLFESISISNFYGNETYFCVGTIYHVLGYIQNLGDFYMYNEYYIHSMIENFIDIFRYVEYIHKDNSKFILKASKYLYRVYDAIIKYFKITKNLNNNSEIIKQLKIKQKLFNNIRTFYQKNSTKTLSNKFTNSLRKFYISVQLNNNNTLNNNISSNSNNPLNDNDIIKILENIIEDIKNSLL